MNLGLDIGAVGIGVALIKNEKVIKTDYKKHDKKSWNNWKRRKKS